MAGNMVLRCRLFALANAAFIAAKHIVSEKEPEKGTCTEAENEPAKNRDKNLRRNLQEEPVRELQTHFSFIIYNMETKTDVSAEVPE